VPSGLTTGLRGLAPNPPTDTVATTALVAVLMTFTVPGASRVT